MKSTLQWIALLIARLSDAVQCIAFNPVIHSLLSCSLTDVGKLVGMCLFCCILFAKNGQFYWIFHGTKSCITLVESTIISCKRGLELWGPGKWLILWKNFSSRLQNHLLHVAESTIVSWQLLTLSTWQTCSSTLFATFSFVTS